MTGSEIDSLIDQLESLSLKNVFYTYDERMTEHAGDKHHPERPDRIRTINDHFDQLGLLKKLNVLPARMATVSELELAHTPALVAKVLSFTSEAALIGGPVSDDPLVKQKQYMFPFDHDTYVCHSTPAAAQLACGSVLNVIDAVMTNTSGRGFAAIRPPGHHACADKSMGFCLFNNVAVAAEYAKKKFNLSRVAIIDWDVHHGNGTSDIFNRKDDVLVISIHRYDKGKFYPGTGHMSDIGTEAGQGYNLNVPIDGSYGDEEMFYIWTHVVLPALSEFKPELVLVSAGFDAAENDPLGQCRVSCKTYGILVDQLLRRINQEDLFPSTKGRLALILEGGYNLKSIAAASVACVQSLLNIDIDPPRSGVSSPSSSDASSSVSSVRSVPQGVPKTAVIKTVYELTKLVNEHSKFKIPIAPSMHPYSTRKDRKTTPPSPPVIAEADSAFLLTSGGGHTDGVVRHDGRHVAKQTSVREALCYFLISEANGRKIPVETLSGAPITWELLYTMEKRRLDYSARFQSFKKLGDYTCECVKIIMKSDTEATVILKDLTHGLCVDENLGVLDIKLGTQYHTPEDAPDRVMTRRQKAIMTSASKLGIRMTACKCMDGFTVSKHKAHKLKLMEQMVPLVRRFLYSSVENFENSLAAAEGFAKRLLESFESKTIDLCFVASSALFVIGKNEKTAQIELRSSLIDLAHVFEPDHIEEADGFVLGCKNLALLFEQAREPSYESA